MKRRQINKAFANTFKNGGGQFGTAGEGKENDIPYGLLKSARHSAQLNLSSRGLTSVPEKVWKINVEVPEEAKSVSLGDSDERWWDQVDLRKLILASNRLSEIPDDLKHLPALTVIDAHDNLIEKISEEIGNLSELVKLHLSHNKLKDLPKSFCNISSLRTLLLASNELEKLPEDIGYLCNLEEIDLMGNMLKTLPESIGNMKLLKKMNLSKNKICELPVGFENLTMLRDLDLSSNDLESLPKGFGKLTSLEILECRYNQIKKFTTFEDTANIKQLFLGYNRIQEVEEDVFEKIPHLVSLDLRDNAISTIPESLTNLKVIERIDLSNNCLSGLPYVIGHLPLKSLSLDGNPLRSIRRDILARGTQAILTYLKSRIPPPEETVVKQPPKNETTTAPKIIQQNETESTDPRDQHRPVNNEPSKAVVDEYLVATTKDLNHSGSDIPESVWLKGAKINTICFTKNNLIEFPEKIIDYSATLGELTLSQNKLQEIPSSVGSLVKLTFLDLSNNLLSSLPDEMTNLVHLMQICLSSNRFNQIPSILYKLPKLQTILIPNNVITEVDVDGLLQLKTLQTLDVSNNNISRIPPQLGKVEWLKSLSLGGNSFRNPRPQILTKGTQFILAYLRDRIPT